MPLSNAAVPINVSRETISRLKIYQTLLETWQKKMNLVSTATLSSMWERHFVDSLQLLTYLPPQKLSLIDLGSGAGFPGLVLAIARPETLDVTLIESNLKKGLFLEIVSRETMVDVTLLRERIELLNKTLKADVITARGLASLSQLLEYAYPLMKERSFCLFLKGKEAAKEIQEAQKKWDFKLEIFPSITDSKARLLKVTALKRISDHV